MEVLTAEEKENLEAFLEGKGFFYYYCTRLDDTMYLCSRDGDFFEFNSLPDYFDQDSLYGRRLIVKAILSDGFYCKTGPFQLLETLTEKLSNNLVVRDICKNRIYVYSEKNIVIRKRDGEIITGEILDENIFRRILGLANEKKLEYEEVDWEEIESRFLPGKKEISSV
jgi:hypothetical protein